MRTLIVGSETDLAGLKSRLFQGRASKAAIATAHAALREANPDIDLDRLKPGTVLRVPKIPELRLKSEVSMGDLIGNGFSELASRFSEVLEETEASSADGLKESKAQQRRLTRLINSAEVKRAVKGDSQLAAEIATSEAAIKARAATDKAEAAASKKAFRQWAGDLEAVRGLLPD